MQTTFDFVVIGGGSAGYAAARTAREFTDSVAIIDGAKELGGLCILRGCMPSKTLLYSAEVLHRSSQAGLLGLHIPRAEADMKALHARKTKIIREFAEYRVGQLRDRRFSFFNSNAHFIDTHTVRLTDGTEVTGRKFFISTGSHATVPEIPGLAGSPFWTSDDVLDMDSIPPSVIVLGGGVVACEMAQFLTRIGSKVCQIQRSPQILRDFSPEAAGCLSEAFTEEGIELLTETSRLSVSHGADSFTVEFEQHGKKLKRSARHLLNALGRTANTQSLNLSAAEATLRDNGQIEVNLMQQSLNPDIYAGGDCTGPYEIVHIAILHGELAARHAFNQPVEPINYDQLLSVVFTDPQVAVAGLTAPELLARRTDFIEASHPFNDHGKSILMEARRGYVRVLAARRDGRLLGAEIVGRDAGELIHVFSTALTLKATVHDLLRAPWYHPTLSEIITYPLEEIAARLTSPQ
ncbi:MAG: NAD(P)/FAD-dependent oxidoreductase [Verrucomicrobiae bacterium]|nr:NAD(P)/FAD-dependent oxidoreductase [Verrucomicrobiae bacterium]